MLYRCRKICRNSFATISNFALKIQVKVTERTTFAMVPFDGQYNRSNSTAQAVRVEANLPGTFAACVILYSKSIARKTDPKFFYAYVRSKSKTKTSVGPLKNGDVVFISDDLQMNQISNSYFGSVFRKENLSK